MRTRSVLAPILCICACSLTASAQEAAPAPEKPLDAAEPAPPSEASPQAESPPPEAPMPATQTQPSPEQQALESEFAAALAGDKAESKETTEPAQPAKSATLALLELSFDVLAAGGGSTVPEGEQRALEGGAHDPKNRGFTIQNVELTFAGVVDPYFRADANVVLQIDPFGESTVELEEAYLTTLDLPLNLQVKAGQFFGAFGRLNATHPHSWDFVDAPVVNTRLLGPDGFRNPGAQLSWLTPLPFFTELIASVQNAQGETATSFRGTPDATLAGRTLIDRDVRNLRDLAYLLRLRTSFDLGDEVTLVPGASALFGPNATGRDTSTQIYGADLYLKWKPLQNDHGWPFVAWQTEAMLRRYEAAAVIDDGHAVAARTTLADWGVYSQLVYAFARPWAAGVRYDYAHGQPDDFGRGESAYVTTRDPERDLRQRVSGVLTFYPSEFSKIRAQYNFDHAQFLANHVAHSVYVQAEVLIGAHGAHKF